MRQYRARRSGLLTRLAGRQEMLCPWCGEWLPEDMAGVDVDHIIPRASGLVIDEEWNYQALHRACNLTKTDQITPEAIELAGQHGLMIRFLV
jgi:5-methylcytosine-specific restriction endonuclease McrA